jgi:pilus assembly protein Flp/PilA
MAPQAVPFLHADLPICHAAKGVIAMFNQCKRFLLNEQGVTSIEYALLGSLIAMIIVAAVQTVGINVCALYDSVVTAFGGAQSC